MAISLKNHDDRIKSLENKIGVGFSDTGWINGSLTSNVYDSVLDKKILRYKVMNGVIYLEFAGNIKATGMVNIGTLPQWRYGDVHFHFSGGGDQDGSYEGVTGIVDTSGLLKINSYNQYSVVGRGTSVFPLTI